MRILRFDGEVSRTITDFGSVGMTLAPIAQSAGESHIVCIRLEPGGFIGHHETAGPQLFLVTQGEGWVQGGATPGNPSQTEEREAIGAGWAALWEAGEGHAAGTATGLTAIVIEGPDVSLIAPTRPASGPQ
ncbi:MAG TPA: hypothetical protein VKQ36_14195 [Ktedonobacterales bacterium]|nr:hypothetical protein [Ktedonobacterales bacterium]